MAGAGCAIEQGQMDSDHTFSVSITTYDLMLKVLRG